MLLGFATVAEENVTLADIGRQFATATILESKDLFRQQVLEFVPVLVNLLGRLGAVCLAEINAVAIKHPLEGFNPDRQLPVRSFLNEVSQLG